MWDDGKGYFLEELVSDYIGYTWFLFAQLKFCHILQQASIKQARKKEFFSGVSYTHKQTKQNAQLRCKEPQFAAFSTKR